MAEYYRLTFNYILDEMTMEDLVMYSRVVPPLRNEDEGEKEPERGNGEVHEAKSIGDFARAVNMLRGVKK